MRQREKKSAHIQIFFPLRIFFALIFFYFIPIHFLSLFSIRAYFHMTNSCWSAQQHRKTCADGRSCMRASAKACRLHAGSMMTLLKLACGDASLLPRVVCL